MTVQTVKHDDWLLNILQDTDFAADFLCAAAEDEDPKTYLTALRQVVQARGHLTQQISMGSQTSWSKRIRIRRLVDK